MISDSPCNLQSLNNNSSVAAALSQSSHFVKKEAHHARRAVHRRTQSQFEFKNCSDKKVGAGEPAFEVITDVASLATEPASSSGVSANISPFEYITFNAVDSNSCSNGQEGQSNVSSSVAVGVDSMTTMIARMQVRQSEETSEQQLIIEPIEEDFNRFCAENQGFNFGRKNKKHVCKTDPADRKPQRMATHPLGAYLSGNSVAAAESVQQQQSHCSTTATSYQYIPVLQTIPEQEVVPQPELFPIKQKQRQIQDQSHQIQHQVQVQQAVQQSHTGIKHAQTISITPNPTIDDKGSRELASSIRSSSAKPATISNLLSQGPSSVAVATAEQKKEQIHAHSQLAQSFSGTTSSVATANKSKHKKQCSLTEEFGLNLKTIQAQLQKYENIHSLKNSASPKSIVSLNKHIKPDEVSAFDINGISGIREPSSSGTREDQGNLNNGLVIKNMLNGKQVDVVSPVHKNTLHPIEQQLSSSFATGKALQTSSQAGTIIASQKSTMINSNPMLQGRKSSKNSKSTSQFNEQQQQQLRRPIVGSIKQPFVRVTSETDYIKQNMMSNSSKMNDGYFSSALSGIPANVAVNPGDLKNKCEDSECNSKIRELEDVVADLKIRMVKLEQTNSLLVLQVQTLIQTSKQEQKHIQTIEIQTKENSEHLLAIQQMLVRSPLTQLQQQQQQQQQQQPSLNATSPSSMFKSKNPQVYQGEFSDFIPNELSQSSEILHGDALAYSRVQTKNNYSRQETNINHHNYSALKIPIPLPQHEAPTTEKESTGSSTYSSATPSHLKQNKSAVVQRDLLRLSQNLSDSISWQQQLYQSQSQQQHQHQQQQQQGNGFKVPNILTYSQLVRMQGIQQQQQSCESLKKFKHEHGGFIETMATVQSSSVSERVTTEEKTILSFSNNAESFISSSCSDREVKPFTFPMNKSKSTLNVAQQIMYPSKTVTTTKMTPQF